jgi:hypothetical protein
MSVEHELKTPASELISAASRPATTRPRTPTGSSTRIISGSAWSARASSRRPVATSAAATRPGITKMNRGRSLR